MEKIGRIDNVMKAAFQGLREIPKIIKTEVI